METKQHNNIDYAHLITDELYDILYKNYTAFTPANISDKAKQMGVKESETETSKGYWTTSIAAYGEENAVMFVEPDGSLNDYVGYKSDAGLRICCYILYDINSKIFKESKMETRTADVFIYSKHQKVKVTSTAPIISIDNTKFIWLNKEDNENDNINVSQLISLDILEKAEIFCQKGLSLTSYLLADKIREQCNRATIKLAKNSEEFKRLLLPIEIIGNNNHSVFKPLENKKEISIEL